MSKGYGGHSTGTKSFQMACSVCKRTTTWAKGGEVSMAQWLWEQALRDYPSLENDISALSGILDEEAADHEKILKALKMDVPEEYSMKRRRTTKCDDRPSKNSNLKDDSEVLNDALMSSCINVNAGDGTPMNSDEEEGTNTADVAMVVDAVVVPTLPSGPVPLLVSVANNDVEAVKAMGQVTGEVTAADTNGDDESYNQLVDPLSTFTNVLDQCIQQVVQGPSDVIGQSRGETLLSLLRLLQSRIVGLEKAIGKMDEKEVEKCINAIESVSSSSKQQLTEKTNNGATTNSPSPSTFPEANHSEKMDNKHPLGKSTVSSLVKNSLPKVSTGTRSAKTYAAVAKAMINADEQEKAKVSMALSKLVAPKGKKKPLPKAAELAVIYVKNLRKMAYRGLRDLLKGLGLSNSILMSIQYVGHWTEIVVPKHRREDVVEKITVGGVLKVVEQIEYLPPVDKVTKEDLDKAYGLVRDRRVMKRSLPARLAPAAACVLRIIAREYEKKAKLVFSKARSKRDTGGATTKGGDAPGSIVKEPPKEGLLTLEKSGDAPATSTIPFTGSSVSPSTDSLTMEKSGDAPATSIIPLTDSSVSEELGEKTTSKSGDAPSTLSGSSSVAMDVDDEHPCASSATDSFASVL
jgi:hypothetical protein